MNGKPPLIVGHTYRTKKPKGCGVVERLCNDRQIVWMSETQVQYDSPSIGWGRHLPRVPRERFEKWVHKDVTDEMPKGEWAPYPPIKTT